MNGTKALGVNTEEKFSLTIYLVSVTTSSTLLNLRCISPSKLFMCKCYIQSISQSVIGA